MSQSQLPRTKGPYASCLAQETNTTTFIELDLELQHTSSAEKRVPEENCRLELKKKMIREEESTPLDQDGLEVFIALLLYNRMVVHVILGRRQGDGRSNWYFET